MLNATGNKHVLIVAPDAGQDGTCNAVATAHATAVTTTPARVCASPSCEACGAGLPVCIAGTGDLACPPSLPKKLLVGDGATLACGQCATCTFTATCAGSVTLYSDGQCKFSVATAQTGVCEAEVAGFPIGSYKWSGMAASATCTASDPPAGTPQLTAPKTICCAP
jgi:hypothetical protein